MPWTVDDPGPLLELHDRLHRGQRLDNLTIRADCGSTRRQATRDLRLMDDALGACLVRVREGAGKAWWALQDGVHRQAVLPAGLVLRGQPEAEAAADRLATVAFASSAACRPRGDAGTQSGSQR